MILFMVRWYVYVLLLTVLFELFRLVGLCVICLRFCGLVLLTSFALIEISYCAGLLGGFVVGFGVIDFSI